MNIYFLKQGRRTLHIIPKAQFLQVNKARSFGGKLKHIHMRKPKPSHVNRGQACVWQLQSKSKSQFLHTLYVFWKKWRQEFPQGEGPACTSKRCGMRWPWFELDSCNFSGRYYQKQKNKTKQTKELWRRDVNNLFKGPTAKLHTPHRWLSLKILSPSKQILLGIYSYEVSSKNQSNCIAEMHPLKKSKKEFRMDRHTKDIARK